MADFTSVVTIRDNILAAKQLVDTLQTIYNQCLAAQAILGRYQSSQAFRAEADHLFTPAQLQELSAMLGDVNTLQTAWFANHKSALGLELEITP